ncbi:MAG: hypothetical protein RLZZ56_444, partial [Actinomycetota bacterium]
STNTDLVAAATNTLRCGYSDGLAVAAATKSVLVEPVCSTYSKRFTVCALLKKSIGTIVISESGCIVTS